MAEARVLIDRSELEVAIEVDGGISGADTAPGARRAGAELLVAGSAILGHPEGRAAGVATLRRSLELPGSLARAGEPKESIR